MTNKISAIGTVAYTAASKAKIDAARSAYNALNAKQKALVTNYTTLTAAETKYAELKKAADDQAAANAAMAKINAIGTVDYSADSKAKINDASVAYKSLTDDQKALVTNADKLTAAEAAYDQLKTQAGEPVVRAVSLADATLICKKQQKLSPTITADAGARCQITYASSNETIAGVTDDGVVTGLKRGTTTITCTVTDESGNVKTADCTVTVKYTWWQWIIVIVLFGWLWY